MLLLVLAGYKVTSVSSYVGNTMSCVEWLPHQENIGMVLWALVTRGQSPDKWQGVRRDGVWLYYLRVLV